MVSCLAIIFFLHIYLKPFFWDRYLFCAGGKLLNLQFWWLFGTNSGRNDWMGTVFFCLVFGYIISKFRLYSPGISRYWWQFLRCYELYLCRHLLCVTQRRGTYFRHSYIRIIFLLYWLDCLPSPMDTWRILLLSGHQSKYSTNITHDDTDENWIFCFYYFRSVHSREKEMASSMMAAFLGIGLAFGSSLSLILVQIVWEVSIMKIIIVTFFF